MWKNLLLRKRHWVLTAFEILLPTLLFTLLLTIRVLPDSAFLPSYVNEVIPKTIALLQRRRSNHVVLALQLNVPVLRQAMPLFNLL